MNTAELPSPSRPPTKRRRCEDKDHSGRSSRPFWYHDGDIVLEVESHQFKVHRSRLMCSDIFSDMLGIPQPQVTDSIDGCPLVQLSDSAQDWYVVLRWMYEPESFQGSPQLVPFPLIPSALRIATKYEISVLRQWAVEQLDTRWSPHLERMNANSVPCAADAIALAREFDVPSILPAAFYALSLQKWAFNADGGRSHLVLAPVDMRRLLVGREYLHGLTTRILLNPFDRDRQEPTFIACDQCHDALQRYWRAKVVADANSPFEQCLLHEFLVMANERDALFEGTLCSVCLAWHKDTAWMRFQLLRSSIPRFFCL